MYKWHSPQYQDCELLGLRPDFGRPEQFIWQYISVPPVAIRPSVAQDGASNEDDLTVKLTEIVFSNALIKQGLAKGAPTAQFMVRKSTYTLAQKLTNDVSFRRSNGNSSNFRWPCISTLNCLASPLKWAKNLLEVSVNG